MESGPENACAHQQFGQGSISFHPCGRTDLLFLFQRTCRDGWIGPFREQGSRRASEPENLGYPINSFGEEMGFAIASDGKTAYFSRICLALAFWIFIRWNCLRPLAIPSAWVKGIVHQQSGRSRTSRSVFTDVHSGEVIHRCISGPDGLSCSIACTAITG